uniref:Uncharacterized protein n=1 Tax=Panagrolaimus davidi TaxID=227884 RepID=A0A914P120_9BILA
MQKCSISDHFKILLYFEKCFAAGKKFTNGEIRYSLNKPIPYVPPQYKSNNVKTLNSDSFWLGFGTCYRQSATFALNCLVKLSSSYCIEDCVKDFKSPDIDFQQQLKNSGVAYTGNLEDAILAFGLPASTTVEQAHFLLTNRFIQRQLTRTPNFSVDKAKANIAKFMENVNVTQFEHVEEVTDLQNYEFIACFAVSKWQYF